MLPQLPLPDFYFWVVNKTMYVVHSRVFFQFIKLMVLQFNDIEDPRELLKFQLKQNVYDVFQKFQILEDLEASFWVQSVDKYNVLTAIRL